MPRQYLSSIDAALLHIEDETNPMTITGIFTLQGPIDPERLKATIASRLLKLRQFRQRVAWRPLDMRRPYWEDDPDLDLDYHVQRAHLPPPGDQHALQDVVSLLASTPLDLARSPWQAHAIEMSPDRGAVVFRMHHCLGDGMAVIHTILSMTDPEPVDGWPPPAIPVLRNLESGQAPAAWRGSLPRLPHLPRPTGQGVDRGDTVSGGKLQPLLDLGRVGVEGALDLARFLLLRPEPDTALRGPLGLAKRAAWSDGVPLEAIRTIRERLCGTLNDVLVTAIAGALRRYLQARGEPVDSLTLRAAVPVNLRPAGEEEKLGNRMGAVFLTLPVWNPEPEWRLRDVALRMEGHKATSEAPMFFVLLNVLGLAPGSLAKKLVSVYGARASAVVTNVKGPQEQLYLAGVPVDGLVGWVPQTGSIGLGISILSYAGKLRVGVLADAGLVPDPEAIVAGFHEEFQQLLDRALEARNPAV